MTPERWGRVKELFGAAMDAPEEERYARLDAACGGDEELQREVQRLLAASDGSSLRSPAEELLEDNADLAPGETLAHYRIETLLGRGGMGAVYRAYDTRLRRQVALKVLSPEHSADPVLKRRLMQEARAASSLNHPNIVTVHDVGSEGGVAYIAMEYLEGLSLAQAIPPEGLPLKCALDYAVQMADGLAAAHSAGLIHRDLKPANVMLSDSGRIKLLDFGLSRRIRLTNSETETVTVKGEIAGTPAYMSPEQVQGMASDERSDIFAFAATLYEMISGQQAFTGPSTVAVLGAVLHVNPPPLKGTPAGLSKLVSRCLRKEPERRVQHMVEVRLALEKARRRPGAFPSWSPSWAGAMACLALLAALLMALNVWNVRDRLSGLSPAPRIEAIAVLPLKNLSGDPNQEYFADGMTEALIAGVSKIRQLRVISRTSVMQYKTAKKALPAIAQELHVDAILEGSVLRSGNRVRITAQLIQAREDRHLWAESYERDVRDVLAVQSEIVQAVATEVKARVTSRERAELGGARAVDPDAHEAYMKGRYYLNQLTEQAVRRAIGSFEDAVAKEPECALYHAGLAQSYAALAGSGLEAVPPREGFPKAKAAALKAIEIDESLSEAHVTLGLTKTQYDWDFAGAEKEFIRALDLNPNSVEAWDFYAQLLFALDRQEEGLRFCARAATLEPLSAYIAGSEGVGHQAARRYDLAVAAFQKAIQLDPNFWISRWTLGMAYVQKGMLREAIVEFERAAVLSGGNIWVKGTLGQALAQSGRKEQALKILGEFAQQTGRTYLPALPRAMILAGLGDKKGALLWLNKAYEDRCGALPWIGIMPWFDNLRSEPAFQNVVRHIGLPHSR